METKTRKEARIAGDKWYFTGKPCKHGHLSKRITSSAICYACDELHSKTRYTSPERKAKRINYELNNYERILCNSARTRARNKNVEFSITPEDIKIPEFCPCLHIPLIKSLDRKRRDNTPSIGRINLSKGYTKDNIAVISWRANWLKSNASLNELKGIISYLEIHNSS